MEKFTTDRRGPDGLNKAERASLRDPATYAVAACNPCRFLVSSKICMADFEIVIGYGRWARMKSNTGSTIDLTVGEPCPCPAHAHSGHCKHMAALEACLVYRAGLGETA